MDLMLRFAEGANPVQQEDVPAHGIVPAVAVCALWRLLCIEGSRVYVIASSERSETEFLTFLRDLTLNRDPAIQSVTRWPRGNVLRLGDAAGHELRVLGLNPGLLADLPDVPTTFIALGARSSAPAFCETLEAMQSYQREDDRHVVIW